MTIYNMAYVDGSGTITSGSRRLHVDQPDMEDLIRSGVEFRGVNEQGYERKGYEAPAASTKRRRIERGPHKPTWVGTFELTDPEGRTETVTNLRALTRERFGESDNPAYMALIQKGFWKGWRAVRKHVGAVGSEGNTGNMGADL